MKSYLAAAAALLLGTSTLAWAAEDVDKTPYHAAYDAAYDAAKPAAGADEPLFAAKADAGWDKSLLAAKSGWSAAGDAKFQSAAWDGGFDKPVFDADDAKLAVIADKPGFGAADRLALADKPVFDADDAEFALAAAAKPKGDYQGMGGPFEPVEDDGALAAAQDDMDAKLAHHDGHAGTGGPIEAQSGYPPCSPGPGDDRCIQLYERGVTGAGN